MDGSSPALAAIFAAETFQVISIYPIDYDYYTNATKKISILIFPAAQIDDRGRAENCAFAADDSM